MADPISTAIALLTFVGVPAGVGISRVVGRWSANRALQRQMDALARAIGGERAGNDVLAYRDGVPVVVRVAVEKSDQEPMVTVYARIDPPLDLGLAAHFSELRIELPLAAPLVDTAALFMHARVAVRADEPARARSLLAGAVGALLAQVDRAEHGSFLLSDQGFALQLPRRLASHAWIRRSVDLAIELVGLVDHARARVAAARPLLGHRAAWEAFARGSGLACFSAPLGISGAIDGSRVLAYAVRTAPLRYALDLCVRFAEPLGLGMSLQPMGALDRMRELIAPRDHRLGDPLFDDAFLLLAADTRGVDALLTPALRQQILLLNGEIGPVSLHDEGLLVRLPLVPPDPGATVRHFAAMLKLVALLAERRRHGRGPYR